MEHASPDARYDPLRHLETVFNTCHSCNARGANKGSRSAPQNRWLFTSGWCNANRSGWGPDIHRCRPTTHETRSMKHTTFPVARDDKRGTAIDKKKRKQTKPHKETHYGCTRRRYFLEHRRIRFTEQTEVCNSHRYLCPLTLCYRDGKWRRETFSFSGRLAKRKRERERENSNMEGRDICFYQAEYGAATREDTLAMYRCNSRKVIYHVVYCLEGYSVRSCYC